MGSGDEKNMWEREGKKQQSKTGWKSNVKETLHTAKVSACFLAAA